MSTSGDFYYYGMPFRRVTNHCFDRTDKTAVESVIRKIMSEIDSSFET
jgi:hypothetical protein